MIRFLLATLRGWNILRYIFMRVKWNNGKWIFPNVNICNLAILDQRNNKNPNVRFLADNRASSLEETAEKFIFF